MRKITTIFLLCFTFSCVAYAGENTPLSTDVFQEITKTFILQQAALNLQENQAIYVQMAKEVDGASGLAWMKILGQAIPSQPIAVIEILEISKVDIKGVCPAFFPEGTEESTINDWNAGAIASLQSFKMVEPKKEEIRKQCLRNIVDNDKRRKEILKNR